MEEGGKQMKERSLPLLRELLQFAHLISGWEILENLLLVAFTVKSLSIGSMLSLVSTTVVQLKFICPAIPLQFIFRFGSCESV